MRIVRSPGMAAAATAGLASALICVLSGPAIAWQGDLHVEPQHGIRAVEGPGDRPAAMVEIPADNAERCGKCHSACENGRIHEGRSPAAPEAGAQLPLTADGRTTCFTCHAPHAGENAADGARLRLSILQRELCLVCHRGESDEGPRIRIVSPPDRSIVQEQRIALIGKVSGGAGTYLAVRINGAKFDLPVKAGQFFTWINLQDGVNRIAIGQEERTLWEGEVFRGESVSSGYGRQTSGHRTENREQCQECHAGKSGKIAGDASDTSALCYGCHDRFEGKRYLHGPLAVGACLACHDPHRGYGSAHLREERAFLCNNCHAPREVAAKPACAGSNRTCADCHDPHQSDSRYLLKGPQYTQASPRRGEAQD